jgi:hypothetical protein
MIFLVDVKDFGVGSILGHFAFVGWVEPTPGFVGFRYTQSNLHFAGVISNFHLQQIKIAIESKLTYLNLN